MLLQYPALYAVRIHISGLYYFDALDDFKEYSRGYNAQLNATQVNHQVQPFAESDLTLRMSSLGTDFYTSQTDHTELECDNFIKYNCFTFNPAV